MQYFDAKLVLGFPVDAKPSKKEIGEIAKLLDKSCAHFIKELGRGRGTGHLLPFFQKLSDLFKEAEKELKGDRKKQNDKKEPLVYYQEFLLLQEGEHNLKGLSCAHGRLQCIAPMVPKYQEHRPFTTVYLVLIKYAHDQLVTYYTPKNKPKSALEGIAGIACAAGGQTAPSAIAPKKLPLVTSSNTDRQLASSVEAVKRQIEQYGIATAMQGLSLEAPGISKYTGDYISDRGGELSLVSERFSISSIIGSCNRQVPGQAAAAESAYLVLSGILEKVAELGIPEDQIDSIRAKLASELSWYRGDDVPIGPSIDGEENYYSALGLESDVSQEKLKQLWNGLQSALVQLNRLDKSGKLNSGDVLSNLGLLQVSHKLYTLQDPWERGAYELCLIRREAYNPGMGKTMCQQYFEAGGYAHVAKVGDQKNREFLDASGKVIDFYAVLGVPIWTDDAKTLRDARRVKLLASHADKKALRNQSGQSADNAMAALVILAHNLLTDTEKRPAYDALLASSKGMRTPPSALGAGSTTRPLALGSSFMDHLPSDRLTNAGSFGNGAAYMQPSATNKVEQLINDLEKIILAKDPEACHRLTI